MFRFAGNLTRIPKGKSYIASLYTYRKFRESVQKGWQIMSVVAITFPPSKNLESYLIDFVKQYSIDPLMMQYILTKLERICLKGARGKTLSVAEIERAMVKKKCCISLANYLGSTF